MKASAAVFMGANLPFDIREFPITPTPAGYGRCRLVASGVCGTDVHFHRGKLAGTPGTVIGHEFVGQLCDLDEEEGKAYQLKKGDYVIADIAVPCGECPLCKSGHDANCVRMQVTNGGSVDTPPHLFGGYAQVNYTPLANLIKIPEGIDPAMAAIFACPGPTVLHALHLGALAGLSLDTISTAVVQGLGPVGLFAVLYLKTMGVKNVYAIGVRKNEEREKLVCALGADRVFSLETEGEEAVIAALQAENDGLGVQLCIECSGKPAAVPLGMQILSNRGMYLIPGQYSMSGGIEIQPQMITFKALQMIGSSQYAMTDVRNYLAFLEAHPEVHEKISPLATCYPIAQTNRAFEDACAGKNIKTVLIP